jgi:hypothetical protein
MEDMQPFETESNLEAQMFLQEERLNEVERKIVYSRAVRRQGYVD